MWAVGCIVAEMCASSLRATARQRGATARQAPGLLGQTRRRVLGCSTHPRKESGAAQTMRSCGATLSARPSPGSCTATPHPTQVRGQAADPGEQHDEPARVRAGGDRPAERHGHRGHQVAVRRDDARLTRREAKDGPQEDHEGRARRGPPHAQHRAPPRAQRPPARAATRRSTGPPACSGLPSGRERSARAAWAPREAAPWLALWCHLPRVAESRPRRVWPSRRSTW